MQSLIALFAGLLFGLGLTVSGMIDPAKVQGFLDVTGRWDPRLAFVLGGAVLTSWIGFQILFEAKRPVLADSFTWPTARQLDRPLVIGAILFGAGWGLFGYCPGPALAALSLGHPQTIIFVIAILAGMAAHRLTPVKRPPGSSRQNA
ncbi:YeeE/YedE family protein [Pacificimonas sp. WHA3]|uniref:YeeE/YedE family protein n=1 Tax=Pacificimonas pallii TaxID=2827236 RepID=A0ABS6SFH9_9SPHN|nr:YeeE/YedE family protein [Pacificimonas pallii]MBV7256607.1 YeeE/YedE family protein [Pacificimonas pallii]